MIVFIKNEKKRPVLKRFYLLTIILPALLILSACTTQKRKGDLSGLGKLYHNTTAKYNGYFNANELMMESTLALEQQHQDNYSKVLPMYKYIAAENPTAVAPNLDEAMKKVTVVVGLHRRSQWTDDCYLLVGQAQFLKQDYETAEETLRYMTEEFSPYKMSKRKAKKLTVDKSGSKKSGSSKSPNVREDKKDDGKEKLSAKDQAKKRKQYNKDIKKKKNSKKKSSSGKKPPVKKTEPKPTETPEVNTPAPITPEPENTLITLSDTQTGSEADPDNYFMKHRPAYQEGVLWLAKTLVERDKMDEAFRLLSNLENDPKTFDDIRREAIAVKAYYFIKRKDYSQAIAQLEKAVEQTNKRTTKARYAFIAAQLYQQQNNPDGAVAAFERVLKLNPPYEMEFSARLNLAQSEYRSGKGTADAARRNLEKLLKDPKNLEYQDQIYFALAEIALREGNRPEGIRNLTLALKNSSQNTVQKAEAYLLLARLYFETEDYVDAKLYYDSTLQVLPPTDERFDEVNRLARNLTDIAVHIKTIELQDSMLRIAEMTDDQKKDLAKRIKEQREEESRRAAEAQAAASAAAQSGKVNLKNLPPNTVAATKDGSRTALQKESSFFAYDDRAIKRGKREFDRRWGIRRLEDDWRRSNRRTAAEETASVEETAASSSGTLTADEISGLLGPVPDTPAEKDEANRQIREAMYKLGSLYRERLKNSEKAAAILEELNRRYPASSFELDSWYLLYVTYTDLGNAAKAREYFDKIITKYPSTNYAKILQDPNFASKFLDEERRQSLQYDEIYGLFSTGKYRDAYDRSKQVLESLLGKHPLKPKYALLMAMCSGSLQGKDTYVNELQRVVAMYPETEEQKRAKEILRLLGASGGAQLPGKEKEEASTYKVEADDVHYVLVVFSNTDVDLNAAKNAVSDYNRKYSKLESLRLANIFLGPDNKTPVLVMRRFKNMAESMDYLKGLSKNKKDFVDEKIGYSVLSISQNNYRQLLASKDVEAYKAFFEASYK